MENYVLNMNDILTRGRLTEPAESKATASKVRQMHKHGYML